MELSQLGLLAAAAKSQGAHGWAGWHPLLRLLPLLLLLRQLALLPSRAAGRNRHALHARQERTLPRCSRCSIAVRCRRRTLLLGLGSCLGRRRLRRACVGSRWRRRRCGTCCRPWRRLGCAAGSPVERATCCSGLLRLLLLFPLGASCGALAPAPQVLEWT